MADDSFKDIQNSGNDSTEDETNGITMLDVLRDEIEIEENVKAVLGGSDDENCTYSQGYIKRQALYSCLTCSPSGTSKIGGVCLACSLKCHENHTMVELYTRRNFKCDCGNSIFGENKCILEPNKDAGNTLNIYNHNFTGLYCNCNRPYPDPENQSEGEMIQCVTCEDWFHGEHLDQPSPLTDSFDEMICGTCTSKYSFFGYYTHLAVPPNQPVDDTNSDAENAVATNSTNSVSSPVKGTDGTDCLIKHSVLVPDVGTLYLAEGWRTHLCQCEECKKMYLTNSVLFLIDPEDTILAYEVKGNTRIKDPLSSRYDTGMEALSRLDRISQVEAIHGYNHMKQELMDYLKKFRDDKKVVREEDIREFFEGMTARKKVRVEPPHFCH